VLEAAAAGVPLVASDAGSIPEVIHGRHVLVQPKSAKSIAAGIVRVARKQVTTTPPKKFLWSTNITTHEKLYRELSKKVRP